MGAGGLNAPAKRFVPKLAVGGLGLSTLAKNGQAKTQEEMDVELRVQESKVPKTGNNKLEQPMMKKNNTLPDKQPSMPEPGMNNFMAN